MLAGRLGAFDTVGEPAASALVKVAVVGTLPSPVFGPRMRFPLASTEFEIGVSFVPVLSMGLLRAAVSDASCVANGCVESNETSTSPGAATPAGAPLVTSEKSKVVV